MKLTARTIIDFVTALRMIEKCNDFLPSKYVGAVDLTMARLEPEFKTFSGWDMETQKAFENEELEVTIHPISINDLPERLPNFTDANIMELLSPMLKDYQPQKGERKSRLAELAAAKNLENKEAGETEQNDAKE